MKSPNGQRAKTSLAFIGIGTNIGDRAKNIFEAIGALKV